MSYLSKISSGLAAMMAGISFCAIQVWAFSQQIRFLEEADVPWRMVVDGKASSCKVWVGKVSRYVEVDGKKWPAEIIAVRASTDGPLWWSVQYSGQKPSRPPLEGATNFTGRYNCTSRLNQITCAVVYGRVLYVRAVGEVVSETEFRKFLLRKVEAIPSDLEVWVSHSAWKEIVINVSELDSFYFDPELSPLPSFTLSALEPDGVHGWRATIRREDGEAALVILDSNFVVKSGRRIGGSR